MPKPNVTAVSPQGSNGSDPIALLKELFPAAITNGPDGPTVNAEALRQLTRDAASPSAEFGLAWPGKDEARKTAAAPPSGRMLPVPEDSLAWNTTSHLFIEGDNLEAIKLLERNYANTVQLIYIDPPYNTGGDFLYRDRFRDSAADYRRLAGRTEKPGTSASPAGNGANGRQHASWLNMMYPRILRARDLLKPSGVMFISIGDEEVHHLRMMCDEVFGAANYCGTFIWEKKKKPSFLDRNMGSVTEYILTYAKDRRLSPPFVAGTVQEGKRYPFNNAGNPVTTLMFPAGSVRFGCGDQLVTAQDMSAGNIRTVLLDDVRIEDGVNADAFRLEGEWRYSQKKLNEMVDAGAEITISRIPFRPNYVNRSAAGKKTTNLLSFRINDVPANEDATEEMRHLFGGDVISYPKPVGLLKYLIRAVSAGNDIVMDFFAGSGTTGAAVLRQNVDDGHRRRFILVQIPEPFGAGDKAGRGAANLCEQLGAPCTIAEIAKERLRREARSIQQTNPLFGDVGFRVFRIAHGAHAAAKGDPAEESVGLFDEGGEGTAGSGSDLEFVYEIIRRFGLPLSVPVTRRLAAGRALYVVEDGVLLACPPAPAVSAAQASRLAQEMKALAETLASENGTTCVFRERSFADAEAKAEMESALRENPFTRFACV